ncbi:hypothetical protein HMH01_07595 [Halovulum dunhuangense]|uniref:Polysaccharide export protein N-terminal domain-containing protein n=1 Tax=Halovulum dunhuangense TaxID=1505036 RepID=A0A849L231_9RHOB|nr:polysaccharide biosynthesis/export family protein [Halovulum dunhuangense]NNU80302.1 hypothetical protein [Halovulum dunhuangense]
MTKTRSKSLPSGFRRATLALTLAASLLAGPALAAYRLQPGDTLRLAIAGLPMSDVQARVDIDGNVNLAWFGTFHAADRTLEELLAEVRRMADGQVVKRYTLEGQLNLIKPRPEDIIIEVALHQPIIVIGDVLRPGELPYRPGLTLRSAIGIAGGAQDPMLAGLRERDPLNMLRWQNDHEGAVLDHAMASLRLWRLGAELDEDYDSIPPTADTLGISPDVHARLLEEQNRLLAISHAATDGQRDYLTRALGQAENRVRILGQQQEKLREALASDEEEEARVAELLKNGLAMAGRAAEARRASVLTATRLLEIEDALARGVLEVTRLRRAIDEFEETRSAQRLDARELARREAMQAGIRMENATRLQGGQNSAMLAAGAGVAEPQVVVYRRDGAGVERLYLALDDMVMPGDTIEVMLAGPGAPVIQ